MTDVAFRRRQDQSPNFIGSFLGHRCLRYGCAERDDCLVAYIESGLSVGKKNRRGKRIQCASQEALSPKPHKKKLRLVLYRATLRAR